MVRASAFGDMTGGGKTLILAAQSDDDRPNKQNTRYVGLYAWNGVTFCRLFQEFRDLFSKNDKDGVHLRCNGNTENGNDLPFSASARANTAIISPSDRRRKQTMAAKQAICCTFDSLVISCDENGLNISSRHSNTDARYAETRTCWKYDASAGSADHRGE